MTEPATPKDGALLQRAVGHVGMQVASAGGRTALLGLGQQGCLRACFPRRYGGALEAVLVNIAGGVADGDKLVIEVAVGQGAELVLATPAAERIYRARPGARAASIDITLTLAAGASLAFLPQETILFDGCALRRTTRIAMHGGASFLGVEALVFGRAAHGETITRLSLRDTIQLRRNGRLVLHDGIRLQGAVSDLLREGASAGGARAVATLVHAAPDASARLDSLRACIAAGPVRAAASCWDGILVARFLAVDGQALRGALLRALSVLQPGTPLPRVWGS